MKHNYQRTRYPRQRYRHFSTADLIGSVVAALFVAVTGLLMLAARPPESGPFIVVSVSMMLGAAAAAMLAFYRWSKS